MKRKQDSADYNDELPSKSQDELPAKHKDSKVPDPPLAQLQMEATTAYPPTTFGTIELQEYVTQTIRNPSRVNLQPTGGSTQDGFDQSCRKWMSYVRADGTICSRCRRAGERNLRR